MRRLSLRTRATLLGTAAFAVLLAVGAFLLVSTLETRLTQASDQLSRSRVRDLLSLARTDKLPASLVNVDDNGAAQVVGPRGQVLATSANLPARPIAHLDAGPTLRTATFRAPDDREVETYRFWYAAGPSPRGRVVVYVGDGLESVSEATSALRRELEVGVPVVVLALAIVFWLVLGRALARLDRIRREVERISEENLHTRVAGGGVGDEVGRLAATMNAMLERLETAVQRQRDFVADVSHDLQSPLASQRLALEVALERPDAIDVPELRSGVLEATTQMESLVRDLLVLASLDGGPAPASSLVDLDALVLEEAVRARTHRDVQVDTSAVSGAPAWANPDDLRRVVRNLLDNAVAHAASRVELAVTAGEDDARLVVSDDGPGVAPEHRERIFDRFYRGETARTPSSGSGLGLAIARGLAERNGGRLELLPSDRGAVLRLVLPSGPR